MLSQAALTASWLELASWKLQSTMTIRKCSPRSQQSCIRGYAVARRENIAGVIFQNGADARAALTRLGGRNGQERGEGDDGEELPGGEHCLESGQECRWVEKW